MTIRVHLEAKSVQRDDEQSNSAGFCDFCGYFALKLLTEWSAEFAESRGRVQQAQVVFVGCVKHIRRFIDWEA